MMWHRNDEIQLNGISDGHDGKYAMKRKNEQKKMKSIEIH